MNERRQGVSSGRRMIPEKVCAWVCCMLVLAGCAAVEPKPLVAYDQGRLGTVAVVATDKAPDLKFEGFMRSKPAGAAAGGGGVFLQCLGGMGGSCSGSVCGAVFLVMLGVCGVAGAVGAMAGAAAAPSADQAAATEAVLARVYEVRTIQESLHTSLTDAALAAGVTLASLPEAVARQAVAAGDYRSLSSQGVDTVLETTLTNAGTSGSGINDPSMAYMEVRARLVKAETNAELFSAEFQYQGRRLGVEGWAALEGKYLVEELGNGYATLGRHIAESVFALYPFPSRDAGSGGGMLSTVFGLAPIDPPTRGQLSGDRSVLGNTFEWVVASGLSPRLRWEAFPRAKDLAAAPADMARVRRVTYDLVVAREENMAPGPIVYRREGVPLNEHTLEVVLQPGTRYFWTVRARFELDGRVRVTEWGTTHFRIRELVTAPSSFSYRFRTPSPAAGALRSSSQAQ